MDEHGLQNPLDVVEGVTYAGQAATTHAVLPELVRDEVQTFECEDLDSFHLDANMYTFYL